MSNITVRLQEQGLTTVQTTVYNPAIVGQLSDIRDVDASALVNGAILVYKTTTGKWTATTLLTQQNIDAGEF